MTTPHTTTPHRHLRITEPSPWVRRFAPLVPRDRGDGRVLDLAAGGGRHARLFLDRGHAVTALDKAIEPLAEIGERAEVIEVDLEDSPPPFAPGGALAGRTFAGVVVCNYLHRPLLPGLVGAVAAGGVFIYETFARGNEIHTKPRNPDHLLRSGELLDTVRDELQVVAYEHGIIEKEAAIAGVIQRICAVRPLAITRDDGEPDPHPVYPTETS